MKNHIFYLIITFYIAVFSASAQSNPWKSAKLKSASPNTELLSRPSLPQDYKILNLDSNELKTATKRTTVYSNLAKRSQGIIVSMPTPTGDFIDFVIFEQKDLEDGLAKKFPNLKSYTGYSVTDKLTEINFTVNALGFNAIITSPNFSTIYIDSYSKNLEQYIIYYKKDLKQIKDFTCLNNDVTTIQEQDIKPKQFIKRSSDGVLRDYRIAIACTEEYSKFHIERVDGQNKTLIEKKEIVLSAIQTSINRVNAVYKRDLAIHLTLVSNNDAIIFIDSDNFENSDAYTLINQSQTVIDNVIGNANYDLGHTFSTGAGGLAFQFTPCNTGSKARGVTGSTDPINDPYDIDFVSHEIGHQFGANHTFNNYCEDNRNNATAFEPGSGSTIMAYAGICAPNVVLNSDDYFHYISIKEIQDFIANAGNCSTNTTLNNTPPQVTNLTNYTIPFGTPFKLTATATDADNDLLTYAWDQLDNERVTNPPVPTATTGPLFRSIKPSTAPTRYFPEYQTVLNGNLTPMWEVIPNVARTINFGVTVRDNNNMAGQITQKTNVINVANTGPFKITAPNEENTSWEQNSSQTITWDVAGTTANGINVSTVNILLSTDGGITFETLIENTPNDGNEVITVPDVESKDARIMIEANNNIFYALSKNISIGYKLVIENFCKDYSLIYNGQEVTTSIPNFIFNVNEPENFIIKDLKITTDIIAAQSADVNIYFKNSDEQDTFSNIVYRNTQCTSTQNLKSIFSNSGVANTCNNINSNTLLKPNENFTAINKEANGQWTILVSKNNPNRSVKVNKLTLTLCGEKKFYVDPDENINNGNIFAVYPNPSNGEFQFYLDSKNNINVTVFDLTGKLLVNKTYNASNANVHTINLAMLAKGVYIFKINDGTIKKSQKIVIN